MSDNTKKTASKTTSKTTSKSAEAKKAGTSQKAAEKGASKTAASKKSVSKKEPKKVDTVETITVDVENNRTKAKRKTTTAKKATRTRTPDLVVEELAADEPIVIEDPIITIEGDSRGAGSGQRHGGFLNMLYRHPRDRMLSGVCGGIADYLGWDAALVRVLWVVATAMTAGGGMIAYAVLSALLPVGSKHEGFIRPGAIEMTEQNLSRASYGLIGLGVLWLLSNFGILSWIFSGASALLNAFFWPAVLVTIGLLLLNRNGDKNYRETLANGLNSVRERAESVRTNNNVNMPETGSIRNGFARFRSEMPVRRSRTNRMIAGVCGGIGQAVGIDANLVRLGFAVMTIFSGGTFFFAYPVLAVLFPSDGGQHVEKKVQDEITIIEHM